MNENINLSKVLKGYENEMFYSPVFGNLRFICVVYPIVRFKTTEGIYWDIRFDGKFYSDSDELCVFPSKKQRDWNEWFEEQKHKFPKTWSEIENYTDVGVRIHEIKHKSYTVNNTPIEKSALALLKILQLIEVGYGGNVLYNQKGHWDGGIYGYTISIRPSSKTYLDGYEIIPIERRNDVVSPIMFKTKEYAEEFIKHEENCSLLRLFNMVAYPRDSNE